MPAARIRQAVVGRDRRPGGKGSGLDAALRVRPAAEHAGRGQLDRAKLEHAAIADRADHQPGTVAVRAVFAPVEPRMRVEDHQPAHDHHEHDDDVEPVPDPRRQAVAVDDPARRGAVEHLAFLAPSRPP